MKMLAVDFGTKRIGLAVGESDECVAAERGVLQNQDTNIVFADLEKIIAEERIEKIVIGMPYAAGAAHTELFDLIKEFGNRMHERFRLPVVYQDERFSTAEYKNVPKKQLQGKSLDALAAVAILYSYFEREKNNS